MREIFIRLTRIDGKLDRNRAENSGTLHTQQQQELRLKGLEDREHAREVADAETRGRKLTIRWIIDAVLALGLALVGAGTYFGGT